MFIFLTYYCNINLLPGAAAPPSDVEVTVQSSRSILVQWGPIEECRDRNGNIVGYHVRYQASGGSVETEVVSGVGSAGGQVLLEGLTPFTNYSIQVAAVNNQSDVGVFSAVVSAQACEFIYIIMTLQLLLFIKYLLLCPYYVSILVHVMY